MLSVQNIKIWSFFIGMSIVVKAMQPLQYTHLYLDQSTLWVCYALIPFKQYQIQ